MLQLRLSDCERNEYKSGGRNRAITRGSYIYPMVGYFSLRLALVIEYKEISSIKVHLSDKYLGLVAKNGEQDSALCMQRDLSTAIIVCVTMNFSKGKEKRSKVLLAQFG